MEKYNSLGTSRLAQYVVHRKAVLDIFEKNLRLTPEGEYGLEKNIHEIIFPLKSTSDDVQIFENQNLWILDERLYYHEYLVSDKSLDSLDNFDVDSKKRPDILIFNTPIAFAEGTSQPYSSIVIIEFKRPGLKQYSDDKNSINQIYSYIRKIREGQSTDKNGRFINLQESTPFYCYIVCDLTQKIKEYAENSNLSNMPDMQGFFGYNDRLHAYIEILSFNKVISDAKKRNHVLFQKLGL